MTDAMKHAPKVGAPDPELRNSPIFDSNDADELSLDLELETGVCYFNAQSYPLGSYVCSGDELLRCEERDAPPARDAEMRVLEHLELACGRRVYDCTDKYTNHLIFVHCSRA